MSPRNRVHRLGILCLGLLSEKITQALSDDEGLNYAVIAEYLSDATFEVVQDLLKNILNSTDNLDAATRFSCLQVLLRHDVRKLDTGMFPHSYYEAILKVIMHNGTGLRQLNLKGVWVRDYPAVLAELIAKLTKLQKVIVPHMVDDAVLEALLNLQTLTFLDVSGESSFTRAGLERCLKSDRITVLDIGNFGKPDVCPDESSGPDLIAALILNLPQLVCLKTYSFTGRALLEIDQINPKHRTKLKYLHDTGTTNEIVDVIVKMCPNLEGIHVDSPEKGVVIKLRNLPGLHSFKLTKPSEYQELLDLSPQLQLIKLNHLKTSKFDLSTLCTRAPCLQTLECYQLSLSYHQLESYFMSLEYVEILHCDIHDSTVKTIMTNAPFLKKIVIGCAVRMTDGDIFRLCAESDFVNLEELFFSCARGLTSTAVELLMGHCANLRVLGLLSGWDIHQEEIDYLRSVILYTNTDLTLLPLEPF